MNSNPHLIFQNISFKSHVIDLVEQSKYTAAFRFLTSKSKPAAHAFLKVMGQKVGTPLNKHIICHPVIYIMNLSFCIILICNYQANKLTNTTEIWFQ